MIDFGELVEMAVRLLGDIRITTIAEEYLLSHKSVEDGYIWMCFYHKEKKTFQISIYIKNPYTGRLEVERYRDSVFVY